MRLRRIFLFNLAALFSFAFISAPVLADDPAGVVTQAGVFTYQAPAGWTIKDSPMSKYKVCFDTAKNNFTANINVVIEDFSGSLDEYVEKNKTAFKGTPLFQNIKFGDQSPFMTTSGITGVRLVVADTLGSTDLQQIFYFFPGPGDKKFVITASSLAADGSTYATTFDVALKTLTLP